MGRPGTAEGGGLSQLPGIIRRRWLIIVAVMGAVFLVAIVHHARTAPSYEATSSVAFQSGTLSDAALQVSTSGSEPQREANTEVLVAHSPEVAEAVRSQLRASDSAEQLLHDVEVEAAPNADVLNVSATTSDPRFSVRLANAFVQQYIAFRAKSQLAGINVAEAKLQEQIAALPPGSSQIPGLESSLQRLAELRAVAGGGANVIGLASSAKRVNKGLAMTLLIAFVIGLALVFSIIFLLESLNRRIETIEDFEREYRLPAFTAVPDSGFRFTRAREREGMLEPYRILRSALDLAAVARPLDTLLVTSAESSEGKTTVAVDLAHAVALTGRQVVLVELDLRRPTFSRHFDLGRSEGLTSALTGDAAVRELLVEPIAELPNLLVLPAGRIPHNPSELLGSPRTGEIISELAVEDGIVILDAPPLNPVADAQALLNNPAINASIIVARLDQTTRDAVRRARAILDRHVVEPLGLVVTGLRDARTYGYGPYQSEPPTLEANVGTLRRAAGGAGQRLRR